MDLNTTDVLVTFYFMPRTRTKDLKCEKQSGELEMNLSKAIKLN